MIFTAIFIQETDGGYVALNPETGTTTQGGTIEESLVNLREATELYLEEFPEKHPNAPALMTTFELANA